MKTRKDVIAFCMTFPGVWEDYPFDDDNWTVMRRTDTRKGFAWIFERNGQLWVNFKAEPAWGDFWRRAFKAVLPAYHMNKVHWNSLILDGSVPQEDIEAMLTASYELCGRPKRKAR